MSTGRGEGEGFHLLDELSSEAAPTPGLFPPGTAFGRGVNPDLDLSGEAAGSADPSPADGLSGPHRIALKLLGQGFPVGEIARVLGVPPDQARAVLLGAVDSVRSRLAGA